MNIRKWKNYAQRDGQRLKKRTACRLCVVNYHGSVSSAVPPRPGRALLCASAGASAGPESRGEEADPAWAARPGPPRMPSETEARSTMARTGAERSWSRHTGLRAAESEKKDHRGSDRLTFTNLNMLHRWGGRVKRKRRKNSCTHSAWWRQVVFVLFASCAS